MNFCIKLMSKGIFSFLSSISKNHTYSLNSLVLEGILHSLPFSFALQTLSQRNFTSSFFSLFPCASSSWIYQNFSFNSFPILFTPTIHNIGGIEVNWKFYSLVIINTLKMVSSLLKGERPESWEIWVMGSFSIIFKSILWFMPLCIKRKQDPLHDWLLLGL